MEDRNIIYISDCSGFNKLGQETKFKITVFSLVPQVGFEVLTFMVMRLLSSEIRTCSPLKVNRGSEEHVASISRVEE
jgi:hypothetical protein